MKIKTFTLIEILIASLIFVSVMVVATSCFALVKKSNENSEDLKIASSCARQVEDFVRAQIKSSSFNGRIMAIDFETTGGSNSYKIYPITQKMDANVAGIVLFPVEGKYVVIFKKVNDSDSSYYFEEISSNLDMNKITPINFLGKMIHPDLCKGMTPSSGVAASGRPFKIALEPRFPAATPAASASLTADKLQELVFEISLDDLLYRYVSGDVNTEARNARLETKKVIRLNLDVENSVGSI